MWSKFETKLAHFWSQADADLNYSNVFLFIYRTKKLFEFPVETDFANEKALTAAQYPPFFQIFLRICFFNIELRFFGTAIQKRKSYSLRKLDVKDIYCLKQIIFFSYSFHYLAICSLNYTIFLNTTLYKKNRNLEKLPKILLEQKRKTIEYPFFFQFLFHRIFE